MQEHRAAATGHARRGVVVDLDDEIVEMVVAGEPIARLLAVEADRPIVMPVRRVLAPGVLGTDRAGGQKGLRPSVTVGPPPQLPGMKRALWRAAIALALVGQDAAAAKGHGDVPSIRGE